MGDHEKPDAAAADGEDALPETSAAGSSEIARGGYALAFYHDDDGTRKLTFHMDKFRGKDAIEGMISLSDEPAGEHGHRDAV